MFESDKKKIMYANKPETKKWQKETPKNKDPKRDAYKRAAERY
jgi:hypothetical protein